MKEITIKLDELLTGLESAEFSGNEDVEISDIAYDSRQVKQGSLFVAISGYQVDGHKYISDAVENGAVAVVGEQDASATAPNYVKVPDARKALADVSARYKDLVHMKNGVAQAHLAIGRDQRSPGPLELNVLKNDLAHQLGLCLRTAADFVTAGQPAEAIRVLEDFHALLVQLPGLIDGLANDGDLEVDQLMLENYLNELRSGTGIELLADSMRYAGRLKVLPSSHGETE